MGRDLSFWKEKTDSGKNAGETYKALLDGTNLEYVCELPTEKILNDVNNAFNDWNRQDTCSYEKNGAVIEIFFTNRICRFDCYNVTEEDMNKIIDIMLEYECPLYDSAIDVRFC